MCLRGEPTRPEVHTGIAVSCRPEVDHLLKGLGVDAPVSRADVRVEELVCASVDIGLIDSGLIGALINAGEVGEAPCETVSRFDSAF